MISVVPFVAVDVLAVPKLEAMIVTGMRLAPFGDFVPEHYRANDVAYALANHVPRLIVLLLDGSLLLCLSLALSLQLRIVPASQFFAFAIVLRLTLADFFRIY